MLGLLQQAQAFMGFLKSRVFAVAILTLVLAFTVFKATAMTKIVTIREGDEVQTYYTMDENPQQILEQSGITLMAYDAVDFTGFEGKLGEISITRAFPVQLVCDGDKTVVMMTGGTVADLLEEAEVTLGENDLLDYPMDHLVEEWDTVTVTRQEIVTRQENIELPYETVTVASSLLAPGQTKVLVEGEPGLQVDTYTQMVIDGQAEEEYLLSQDLVKSPVNEEILMGFAAAPVSQLDFGYAFDEDGEPVGYSHVLRGQRAAGYSARAGAKTASGRQAMEGHVAVNPNVIPYGSKLYIESTDGNFVYGYAVAADTGTALMQGVIAVDLFYDTYAESAQNGIRIVDIYVLE